MATAGDFEGQQRRMLERIARGAPIAGEVLEGLVELIEHQAEGMVCSLLLVEQGMVRHVAAPSLPPAYAKAIDGARIGPAEGSCGAAAHRRTRIIVEDIATDPLWTRYRELALPLGLRACWSTPILSPEGEVVGTFAMYYRTPRGPTDQEIAWVEAAIELAAIAIVRDREDQARRASELRAHQIARLYAVSTAVHDVSLRSRDPQELYNAACRIAVEHGLARLAWIGFVGGSDLRVQPAAKFGADDGYIDSIVLSMADANVARGPAGRALRDAKPAISNDLATDPTFYWKDAALQRGLHACAVFPLKIGDRAHGVFVLYAEQAGSFQAEEIAVLSALADAIAFAVDAANRETQRRQLLGDLGERVKELTLLHRAGRLLQGGTLTTTTLDELVAMIPRAYQFPRICAARISWSGLEATSPLWGPAAHRQTVSFEGGEVPGTIEVAYVEPPPCDPPFAREEEEMLRSLAALVGAHLRREYEIAQRHRLESQLQQVQRMQSLGTLAGGIAHDFNNILAAIAFNIELVLIDMPDVSAVEQHLIEIKKASVRATELVRQILAFSRREPLRREPLDLRSVITEALKLVRATTPATIELRVDLAPDLPLVSADATQIHQVIMNLTTNAVQAIRGNTGAIDVRLSSRVIDHERRVLLRITDSGCGMDAATLERAFDPFFTTKARGEGTGLGLSVVHGIVENHGATIAVTSEPGRGTTFELAFPATEGELAPPVVRELVRGSGQRVLYVDDEAAIGQIVARSLRRLGFAVTCHADPLVALEDFRARPSELDCVITDYAMPGMTGADLVAAVREIRPGMPAVITSGFIGPEGLEAVARLGIQDVVAKPCTIGDLASAVVRVLGAP